MTPPAADDDVAAEGIAAPPRDECRDHVERNEKEQQALLALHGHQTRRSRIPDGHK